MARRLHAYLHRLGPSDAASSKSIQWRTAEARHRDPARPRAHRCRARGSVQERTKIRPAPFGPIFQLWILTGARRIEIAALRWSEIKDDTIILPRDRTKTGQVHSIPLAPQALAILKQLPRIGPSDFVFTVTGRNPVTDFSGSKKRLDDIPTIPPWRIHDLRRTVATGLQRLGTNLQVIEAVLGHVGGSRSGIVGVYQRHSFDA